MCSEGGSQGEGLGNTLHDAVLWGTPTEETGEKEGNKRIAWGMIEGAGAGGLGAISGAG